MKIHNSGSHLSATNNDMTMTYARGQTNSLIRVSLFYGTERNVPVVFGKYTIMIQTITINNKYNKTDYN